MKQILILKFDMKGLKLARKMLEMRIGRDKSTKVVYLSQTSYFEKLVDKFSVRGANLIRRPLPSINHQVT